MGTELKSPEKPPDDARRNRLLDAALGVFLRYGFRKTSMDQVARAADVSRQGLYLHFATKEDLFLATLQHSMEVSLRLASEGLSDVSLPLEERLVRGFDAWVGRYVGMLGADARDLSEVLSASGMQEVATRHETLFLEAVAKLLRASGLVAAYKSTGLTARQLTDTLYATARGLKYSSGTREAFVQGIGVAIRALCMPLGASR
ncbi:TetR/AcrR family transcriptional regulator [Myxococcus sp. CA051A]|uniref:TetR/AcrR family transcriptional regulator n=1 Tax=unclassified Myxococcus TaxID=2648731 RepID=UPI00157A4650|nr:MULTISPECIES: TetR/AcrR family transcriptional regulator [unclassified Myxococcus]NTX16934.1 TetR/AcrR family transcriptional regulator [Myxococcus sp. CA056]NTX36676.1 TetR/AcrR family transcriptional regulator [Myxococcus sp. CA033]NTX66308.1 TetR/AcrR family transcriptional regulator [Myxococcus sp. CA051A]